MAQCTGFFCCHISEKPKVNPCAVCGRCCCGLHILLSGVMCQLWVWQSDVATWCSQGFPCWMSALTLPSLCLGHEMWGQFSGRGTCSIVTALTGLVRPGLRCHSPSFLDFPTHSNTALTAIKGCGSVNSDTCMSEAVVPLRMSPG